MMGRGLEKKNKTWRKLRSLRRWQLVSCCATFQVWALVGGLWLFVAQPLAELDSRREKIATDASTAQLVRTRLGRVRSLRQEQTRLGFTPNAHVFSEKELEEGKHMNFLLEQMSGIARGVGISIRSFERAGQGLNSAGFAQVTLDTNFLQMISFLEALSQISVPVRITEFRAHQMSSSADKISFSLTISLPPFEPNQEQTCPSS
jgi:hypothetical protein